MCTSTTLFDCQHSTRPWTQYFYSFRNSTHTYHIIEAKYEPVARRADDLETTRPNHRTRGEYDAHLSSPAAAVRNALETNDNNYYGFIYVCAPTGLHALRRDNSCYDTYKLRSIFRRICFGMSFLRRPRVRSHIKYDRDRSHYCVVESVCVCVSGAFSVLVYSYM